MRSKIGLYKYIKQIKITEEDYNYIKKELKIPHEPLGRVISLLIMEFKRIPKNKNIFTDLYGKY